MDVTHDWSAVERLIASRPTTAGPSWQPIMDFIGAAEPLVAPVRARVQALLAEWNSLLADFGGDPSARDWTTFRPLRPSREEDWSDWLAHLIQACSTGYFAHCLLVEAAVDTVAARLPDGRAGFAHPLRVERELDTEDRRRADVVIQWSGATDLRTHIEVKVGDENFEKTYDTACKLRKLAPSAVWADFILIPEGSMQAWLACKTEKEGLS